MRALTAFSAIIVLITGSFSALADGVLPDTGALCSSPSPIDRLACRIDRQAKYNALDILAMTGHEPPLVEPGPGAVEKRLMGLALTVPDLRGLYDTQVALGAIAAVPIYLSSAQYAYEQRNAAQSVPPHDIHEAIARGIGICGNHAALFETLLNALGLRTRPVQFWWRDKNRDLSHIAVEVFISGAWKLYDPTFSAYFVDTSGAVISTKAARGGAFSPVVNPLNDTYRSYVAWRQDPFAHLRLADVSTTIGYQGVILLHLDADGGGTYTTRFANVPNYVGDNQADGDPVGISFRFAGLDGLFNAVVDVEGAYGCGGSVLHLNEQAIPLSKGQHTVTLRNPSSLRVDGTDDVCYVLLHSLRFEPVDG